MALYVMTKMRHWTQHLFDLYGYFTILFLSFRYAECHNANYIVPFILAY